MNYLVLNQEKPIFDCGEWKVSGIYLQDILGKASEVTVIIPGDSEMSTFSDTIAKPHKVKIASDIQREVIISKVGRTAEGFFNPAIVDERTVKYQLTTSVSTYLGWVEGHLNPGLFNPKPKLYIPSTLNIDLILWHTQLIVCAENVKSWFKSWVISFTFQAYILPHTLQFMWLAYLNFILEF